MGKHWNIYGKPSDHHKDDKVLGSTTTKILDLNHDDWLYKYPTTQFLQLWAVSALKPNQFNCHLAHFGCSSPHLRGDMVILHHSSRGLMCPISTTTTRDHLNRPNDRQHSTRCRGPSVSPRHSRVKPPEEQPHAVDWWYPPPHPRHRTTQPTWGQGASLNSKGNWE